MASVDLKKLKEEIDQRKSNINERSNALGEKPVTKQSGDQFLKELMHSARTGQETNASVKVKAVDRVAESKITGKAVDPNLLNHIPKSTPSASNTINEGQPKRTAAMDAKIAEAKRISEAKNGESYATPSNAGLADAISQYSNTPTVGSPMNNNNGYLNEQEVMKKLGYNPNNLQTSPLITEQVTKVAKDLLNENFGKLYAEAMKNDIIETYKAEVIREAINENRSFIKQIVHETIVELQKKAQSKN